MADTKWTDGPWFVRERPTDDGLAVIEDGRDNGLFPITCEFGEAYLIASAPDMAAELKETLEGLEELLDHGMADISAMTVLEWVETRVFAQRDLLSKARGES